MFSRKEFIQKLGLGSLAAATGAVTPLLSSRSSASSAEWIKDRHRESRDSFQKYPVRFGLIGAGGQGQANMSAALKIPGVSITAACDLYDSRLERCKEIWGKDLYITRNYEEILDRKDVDAVIIATPDHWHERIATDALKAGIPVYIEKPMIQYVEEGERLVKLANETQVPFQVGSQRTSSILFEKAKELYQSGAIGNLNLVDAYWDRFSAIGAWQYSIPPSASSRNVDWKRYREGLPNKPFDAMEFFRWRNYDDYGTGVAGDLFVHLFSGLHFIMDSMGPKQIMASGGLRFWHDGRDAEDVVLGLYNYEATETHPDFSMALRVNFANGSGGSQTKLIGDEGELVIGWDRLILRKAKLSDRPGKSVWNMSEEVRNEYDEWYETQYPETRARMIDPSEFVYQVPQGYSDGPDHFLSFLKGIRDGEPIIQDAEFGLRAAGPAVLTSQSLRTKSVVSWDPVAMKVV